MFSGDMIDISVEVPRVRSGTLVPRRRRLEIHFSLKNSDGSPLDARELLKKVIDTANAQLPFAYRLDVDGGEFLRAAEMFGASRVLQKPIEAENLLQVVRTIIG
jgi:hypothetical protein